jgi:hypothetical protein
MLLGKLDSHKVKNEIGSLLHSKINSKMIKYLNMRPESTKVKDNLEEKVFDNNSLYATPKTQEGKAKKKKKKCTSHQRTFEQQTSTKWKGLLQTGRKFFAIKA